MERFSPERPVTVAPPVVVWRPNRAAAVLLNVLAVPLLVIGLVGFLKVATLHGPASGKGVFGVLDLLLFLLITALLAAVMFVAHEAVHGLVMAAFGATPRFAALMIAGLAPALYTTAPGHLFSRAQYLAVAVTPAAVISVLGALACLTPVGLFFVVPLSIHISGCIGDIATTVRLSHEPRGTLCEDLRDGIRFHRPEASA